MKIPKGYRSKNFEDRRNEPRVADKKKAIDMSYLLEDHFEKMDTKARKNVGPRTKLVYETLKKRRKH
jgi:hypothetical protein